MLPNTYLQFADISVGHKSNSDDGLGVVFEDTLLLGILRASNGFNRFDFKDRTTWLELDWLEVVGDYDGGKEKEEKSAHYGQPKKERLIKKGNLERYNNKYRKIL